MAIPFLLVPSLVWLLLVCVDQIDQMVRLAAEEVMDRVREDMVPPEADTDLHVVGTGQEAVEEAMVHRHLASMGAVEATDHLRLACLWDEEADRHHHPVMHPTHDIEDPLRSTTSHHRPTINTLLDQGCQLVRRLRWTSEMVTHSSHNRMARMHMG